MKRKDVIDGIKRLLDAATEKFNALCEVAGRDPDDPELNGEFEEEAEEEIEGADGDAVEGAAEGEAAAGDENVMPSPENAELQGADATAPGMEQLQGVGAPAADVAFTPEMAAAAAAAAPEGTAGAEGAVPTEDDEEAERLRQAAAAGAAV